MEKKTLVNSITQFKVKEEKVDNQILMAWGKSILFESYSLNYLKTITTYLLEDQYQSWETNFCVIAVLLHFHKINSRFTQQTEAINSS